MYNPDTMPVDLLEAHKANNNAVLELYGLSDNASDSEIVNKLYRLYKELIVST